MYGLSDKNKPVKIRSYGENKKYGVAAQNVKELIKKGCKLLKIPLAGAHVCLYSDGTEVTEEYFQTLPDNTELVLLSRPQTWTGVVCDISQLLSTDPNADAVIAAARRLLAEQQSPKWRKILSDMVQNLEDRSEQESREEDQDWFRGVEARFKTKSAYMKYNCESRMRSYMKEVDNAAKAAVRAEFVKVLEQLAHMLKSAGYNGRYFDRTEKECHRLCTGEGWFTCQGPFDQAACLSLHSINPYSSRDSRVMFSMWNLDHRIEKKRAIIPALLGALQNHPSSDLNLDYFYRMLFTRDNLKLVQIVCHKKGAHNLLCDDQKIYKGNTKQKAGGKRRRLN
ncbi:DNA fragmentation factor subunit beta [Sphaeramia orbicularis]|uniref:DNA fragmentation factor subunit beta n=1 Tax=Sphaeramia orbicularis TaxID=375764 RepID=A0A672YFE0_9TELE|nr:DNA fragmentation factor subunit beta [Sphaeramia orbicularis]